ncbi:MAG: BamA/TamA family outer membrane protein [Bacteroidota bacterium]
MQKIIYYIFIFFSFAAFFSCSPSRYLPQGDALYTGPHVKISDDELRNKEKKNLRKELETLTRPKPNKSVLGIRFKLFFYALGGKPGTKNAIGKWIQNKLGEPPVLLSDVNVDYNSKVLLSTLQNRGFFHAAVSGDTVVKKRKGTAIYTIQTGPRYFINEIHFSHDSSVLTKTILEDSLNTFLKKEKPFDLDVIKSERERIDARLKEKGFYYFNPDYIIVQVDTTIGTHKVNLYVKPKPQTPIAARKIYTINDVYIFTNFQLNGKAADTLKKDAVFHKGYYVLDKRKLYKPKLFEKTMQFKPGEVYNRTDHNLTINRLVNLGLFKFVKNRFEVVATDSPRLNAYYYLTPLPKKSLRTEVNANTKSNNLTGTALSVGWRNRNTFKAGELFTIDATGGLEYQYSSQFNGYNTYRAGLETNLTIPRFIVPFLDLNTQGGFVPKTNILLAYDVLNKKKLYTLNSFRFAYGYNWKEDVKKEHQLNPFAVTYVQPINVSDEYKDSVKNNPYLSHSIEKQFILGSTYNYNYNGISTNRRNSGFYFNGNIDLSGNVAGLISGANVKEGNPKYIANAQFSQYIRLEGEVRNYTGISSTTIWANRIIAGFGYPYGNSQQLPYIKQFFVGGNNSLRAFRSRSVGPGTYHYPEQTDFLPDQSGDIKLELNSELRAKLFSIVNGAIFVDAGNTWLYNADTARPGGQFSKQFLKELAVGTGVGLRFDVTFLVLRLDVAFPLRKPYLPDGQRWVINQINFGDPDWRKQNIIYNIAIGYPF